MLEITAAFLDGETDASSEIASLTDAYSRTTRAEWQEAVGGAPSVRVASTRRAALAFSAEAVAVHVFGEINIPDRAALLARLAQSRDAADAADALCTLCWGRYVAFLVDGGGSFALRDPSGAVPLHVARFDRVRLAATHITPALLRAAALRWRTDVSAVTKLLANPPAAGHLSALAEIEIAVPGRLLSMRDRAAARTIWAPSALAQRRPADPAGRLTSTLDAVLPSLLDPRGNGVELSGGFDSSVVFASLARIGANPKPFNFATAGRGGDETRYAQDVAARWRIPLRVHSSGLELPDYTAFDTADHGVQPVLHGLDSVFARARQDLIDREGVGRILTGQGGDALFFRLPTRLVALDRRRELGPASLFARSTLEDARRVNGSIWSVMMTGLGRRTGDDRPELDWMMSHLLSRAATEHLRGPQPRHPWLDGCDDLPPGKIFHLMMLTHCQLFHGRRLFAPSVNIVHPLLTQPLIEVALGCPTYVLQSGSIDRGLARAAFSDRLPPSVLGRRSKGEASDHYARAILHNREWLRNHLLDGRLAEIGLLDAARIEQALDPGSMRLGTDYRSFVQYASIESWMRYWT